MSISVLPSVPLPQTPDELARCLADPMWRICSGALYKIMIKGDDDDEVTILPFKPNQAQLRLLRRIWHRNVILKARQLGMTTMVSILWLDHALFNENQRCGIIAHNREDAEIIFRDKVQFAYYNLPEVLRKEFPLEAENKSELLFGHNNSSIRVSTSMRSGTIHRLLISEYGKICAKFPDKAVEVQTGSIPAVPKSGVLVIESTAEGREGNFYEITQRAQANHELKKKLTAMDYRYHFYAWWQAPEYRLDPAKVIITQEDHDYFNLLETRILQDIDDSQRAWYVATRDSTFTGDKAKMRQEYPSTAEEAFQGSTEGAYYTIQLTNARKDGRITKVPYDPRVPVNTFWDIGNSDETGIWLHQRVGIHDRFIGYFEGTGEPPSYYVAELQKLGYVWGKDYLPHDGAHRKTQSTSIKTYAEMLGDLGRRDIEIVPRIDDVTRGIQMVREKFGNAWFDEEKCKTGLKHLENYKKAWNQRLAVWSDRPQHSPASNCADALRQWAQGYNPDTGYVPIQRDRGSWKTA